MALTVVPVLAYMFIGQVKLNVDEDGEPKNSPWIRAYTPTIHFVLRGRATKWAVLAISTILFIGATALVPLLPTQFIDAGWENLLQVTVAPPAGTSSEAVLDRAIEAETILLADPEVEAVQTSVPGEGDTSFGTVQAALSGRPANSATLTVRLSGEVDLTTYAQKLSSDLAPVKTDGYDVAVAQTAGFSSNGLNVVISSDNPDDVAVATDEVMAALSDNDDLLNLKSDLSKGTPEVQVVVDPNKAIGVGLTAAQVAGEVRAILVGTQPTTIPPRRGRRADAGCRPGRPGARSRASRRCGRCRSARPSPFLSRRSPRSTRSMPRAASPASTSPLRRPSRPRSPATTPERSPWRFSRRSTTSRRAGAIPAGVTITLAGVTEQMNEAFGNLFVSMGVAILLVYVMMVLTFNSLVTPFIILFSLPLALIGAFPALYLTGKPIGVSALIGFLMLIGIVVTNAIVLLDLVERLRSEGHSTKDALIEGGRTRVRPILMTAIATILALIPLAAGLSEGSIIAAELGTVVIGGLFSSTFLTLLVIPVLYSLVDGGQVGPGPALPPYRADCARRHDGRSGRPDAARPAGSGRLTFDPARAFGRSGTWPDRPGRARSGSQARRC